mgnify:FL=1
MRRRLLILVMPLATACATLPEKQVLLECAALNEFWMDRMWSRELALQEKGIQPYPAHLIPAAILGHGTRQAIFDVTNEYGSPDNEFHVYEPSNEVLESEIRKAKALFPSDMPNEELHDRLEYCREVVQ